MILKKMNSKAQIAIGLLVFMAVGLALFTIYIFISHSNKVDAKIIDARFLEEVYMKESHLNFYIDLLIRKTINDFDGSEGDFIEKFKKELEDFKINDEFFRKELLEIKENISEDNVEIQEGKISISLVIKLDDRLNDKFIVSYLYHKKFEKLFK